MPSRGVIQGVRALGPDDPQLVKHADLDQGVRSVDLTSSEREELRRLLDHPPTPPNRDSSSGQDGQERWIDEECDLPE